MGYGEGGIKALIAFLGALIVAFLGFISNLFGFDLAAINVGEALKKLPFIR